MREVASLRACFTSLFSRRKVAMFLNASPKASRCVEKGLNWGCQVLASQSQQVTVNLVTLGAITLTILLSINCTLE